MYLCSTIANAFILLTTQLAFNFSLRAGIILAGVKFNMATAWKILEIPGGPMNLRKHRKSRKKQKNSSFETLSVRTFLVLFSSIFTGYFLLRIFFFYLQV